MRVVSAGNCDCCLPGSSGSSGSRFPHGEVSCAQLAPFPCVKMPRRMRATIRPTEAGDGGACTSDGLILNCPSWTNTITADADYDSSTVPGRWVFSILHTAGPPQTLVSFGVFCTNVQSSVCDGLPQLGGDGVIICAGTFYTSINNFLVIEYSCDPWYARVLLRPAGAIQVTIELEPTP